MRQGDSKDRARPVLRGRRAHAHGQSTLRGPRPQPLVGCTLAGAGEGKGWDPLWEPRPRTWGRPCANGEPLRAGGCSARGRGRGGLSRDPAGRVGLSSPVAPSPCLCRLGDHPILHGATSSSWKSHRPLRSGGLADRGAAAAPRMEGLYPCLPCSPDSHPSAPPPSGPTPSWSMSRPALAEGWAWGRGVLEVRQMPDVGDLPGDLGVRTSVSPCLVADCSPQLPQDQLRLCARCQDSRGGRPPISTPSPPPPTLPPPRSWWPAVPSPQLPSFSPELRHPRVPRLDPPGPR